VITDNIKRPHCQKWQWAKVFEKSASLDPLQAVLADGKPDAQVDLILIQVGRTLRVVDDDRPHVPQLVEDPVKLALRYPQSYGKLPRCPGRGVRDAVMDALQQEDMVYQAHAGQGFGWINDRIWSNRRASSLRS